MSISTKSENHPGKDWRDRASLLGLDNKNWLRTQEAVKYSGIHVSTLYTLTPHKIKSFLLKHDPHAVRGLRLWSRSSIDAYFNEKFEEALATGNPAGQVAWAKEKA